MTFVGLAVPNSHAEKVNDNIVGLQRWLMSCAINSLRSMEELAAGQRLIPLEIGSRQASCENGGVGKSLCIWQWLGWNGSTLTHTNRIMFILKSYNVLYMLVSVASDSFNVCLFTTTSGGVALILSGD